MIMQMELFAESRRLADLPLEQRHAGALAVLHLEPDLDMVDKLDLLLLVVAPGVMAVGR
jgi:hypothetical protein